MEDTEALDLAADWADISQGLRKDLGHQLHSQWIKPIQLGGFCDGTGTLGARAMESIGDDGFTSSVGLDPSLTFAAFVTGTTNVLA